MSCADLCSTLLALAQRHPLLPQWDLLDYCEAQQITVQAHTPLGHGSSSVLGHPDVSRVACEAGISPAQVLLQWNLRHGIAVVTKCSSAEHARQALAVTTGACGAITAAHMEQLDQISQRAERPLRLCDPTGMSTYW